MKKVWSDNAVMMVRELLLNYKLDYDDLAEMFGVTNHTIRQRISRYGLTKEYQYSKHIGDSSKVWLNKYPWTYLYYIPEHHYIGITNDITKRMIHHRMDKVVDGFEILGRFERRVDAHYMETLFHMRGYQGFRDLGRK